jgi:hypothetical protein
MTPETILWIVWLLGLLIFIALKIWSILAQKKARSRADQATNKAVRTWVDRH